MWPFLRRQKKNNSESYPAALDHRPRPMRFAQLVEGDR